MRIWDFDGVIFNSQGNYTDDFLMINQHNKSLVATLPTIYSDDVLITGRSKIQQDLVREILSFNNIKFDCVIFSDFTEKDYKSKNFFTLYYEWKMQQIHEKADDIAMIIDDDEGLIGRLMKLRLGYRLIHIKDFNPDLRTVCKE